MKAEDFKKLVRARLDDCQDVLTNKGEEYSRGGDRLHNFKTAARIENSTPAQALWGMYLKHLVSVKDMISDLVAGHPIPKHRLTEKIGDSINYHLLLEGIIEDHNQAFWEKRMKPAKVKKTPGRKKK